MPHLFCKEPGDEIGETTGLSADPARVVSPSGSHVVPSSIRFAANRSGWIRTSDHVRPRHVRYLAALHSVNCGQRVFPDTSFGRRWLLLTSAQSLVRFGGDDLWPETSHSASALCVCGIRPARAFALAMYSAPAFARRFTFPLAQRKAGPLGRDLLHSPGPRPEGEAFFGIQALIKRPGRRIRMMRRTVTM